MDYKIYSFGTLGSTSTFASENAERLILPAVITADEQTSGRGRRGNSFYSPAGSGLYMTLLFECEQVPGNITPTAAVTVCRALEKLAGINPGIKWVNDIFLDGKKICGILTERFIRGNRKFISVGIGINLTTKDFPEELCFAGSAGECDKNALLNEIASGLLEYSRGECRYSLSEEYEKRLFIKGCEVSFIRNGKEITGIIQGTDENFRLIVSTESQGVFILDSGEINVKIMKGGH